MKFQVKFGTASSNSNIACFYPRKVGLSMLDRARSTLNIPKLSATRVSGHLPNFSRWCIEVELGENQAIEAGQFIESYEINVTVPRESLNWFYHIFETTEIDETSGEVVQVNWVYQLDEDALIAAWFDACCPLEWDPGAVPDDDPYDDIADES